MHDKNDVNESDKNKFTIDLSELIGEIKKGLSEDEWKELGDEIKTNLNKLKDGEKLPDPDWKIYAMSLAALRVFNPSGLAYEAYLDALKELENRFGKINFVPALEEIDDQIHKDNYLTYFFKRAMGSELFSGLQDSMEVAFLLEDEKKENAEGDDEDKKKGKFESFMKNLVKKQTKRSDKETIERYFVTWDFILNNFLNPIFYSMLNARMVPRAVHGEYLHRYAPRPFPTHLRLRGLEEYFNDNDFCDPLKIWVQDMNTRLRNCLVHEKYYIKDDVIRYFYKERQTTIFEQITIRELKDLNAKQFVKIMLIPRIIGMKLFDEMEILDGHL